ncbi:hypothetical protein [Coxiella endosymbiont of Ornithodoros maritimus]|uniref:hypothetical protein n=1 Tax=Coxiella endosymbiont of Ornithodoros maritimus TaxID=1656172 RepID=UPI002263C38D|nr:hypothetical protein [Coxiella endosymbiont of Ornithodoros maritimus]
MKGATLFDRHDVTQRVSSSCVGCLPTDKESKALTAEATGIVSFHHDINSVQREIPRIPEGLRARAIVRELILYNRLDQDPRLYSLETFE